MCAGEPSGFPCAFNKTGISNFQRKFEILSSASKTLFDALMPAAKKRRASYLLTELKGRLVKSGEIVGGRFGSADLGEGAIGVQQHLGGAELAVVVVAHGEAVGSFN